MLTVVGVNACPKCGGALYVEAVRPDKGEQSGYVGCVNCGATMHPLGAVPPLLPHSRTKARCRNCGYRPQRVVTPLSCPRCGSGAIEDTSQPSEHPYRFRKGFLI